MTSLAVFWLVWPQGGRIPKLANVLCTPLGPEHFTFCLVRIGPHFGGDMEMRTWRKKCSHFFGFFGLHSCSFGAGCAIVFHISPLHKLRPQLSEKHLGQSTSLTVLEIWPIKNIFKIQIFGNCACVTRTMWVVACDPWGSTSLATETEIWGSNMGARLPGVEISNFWPYSYLLYFGLHFLCTLTEYRGTQCINARKIHFKTTPKIGGLKMFGGMALFAFAAFGGLYPHFTRAYYGPKYADKNSFILRELLSIWLRYGISNFQNAGDMAWVGPQIWAWRSRQIFGNFWMGAWATPPGSKSVQCSLAKFYPHGCF